MISSRETKPDSESVYDVAVVGAGMIGSASAKYLAVDGYRTLLIGAREADGSGIHGSHHDQARITRYSGPDLIWSELASRAMERFESIEDASGLTFHVPCGHLRCDLPEHHPKSSIRSVREVMRHMPVDAVSMSHEATRERFPYLHFSPDAVLNYEDGPAGIINPRILVKAQIQVGRRYGLTVVNDIVSDIVSDIASDIASDVAEDVASDVAEDVQEDAGAMNPASKTFTIRARNSTFRARNVLVSAGPYTSLMPLLPVKANFTVRPETVLLVEVEDDLLHQFSTMPGIIWNFNHHPVIPYAYVLPPVLYPDGKHYIKIGADHDKDVTAESVEDYDAYMSGEGSSSTAAGLLELLLELIPSLDGAARRSKPCLLTYTAHGNPYIDEVAPHWYVAAGGCGKSAKSSDQIGYLASRMIGGKPWPEPFRRADFAVSSSGSFPYVTDNRTSLIAFSGAFTMHEESWTHIHDLALVFLTLAYSTDSDLADEEVDAISASVRKWRPTISDSDIHEVVLEAASVFFESDAEREFVQSVRALGEALNVDDRRDVLEDVMRIAEADGVLLNSEQNLLSILASAWDIKATKDRLIDETSARLENDPEWSVMHDIALMYLIMGHSSDGDLVDVEIQTMLERLGEWEPDLSEEDLRSILRTVLQYYAQSPDKEDIQDSINAVKEALRRSQRLIVLDDLITIAKSDGEVTEAERDIVESLSAAWRIDVRIAY